MPSRNWIAVGAFWTGLAVVLGAFGAHALKARLGEAGQVGNWETAVRYQAWHGLALVLLGVFGELRGRAPSKAGWAFLIGSLFFSGSLYGLCLGGPGPVLGPITPLGGVLLISGWALFAIGALAGGAREPMEPGGE